MGLLVHEGGIVGHGGFRVGHVQYGRDTCVDGCEGTC